MSKKKHPGALKRDASPDAIRDWEINYRRDNMSAKQKIRVKVSGYDHSLVESALARIIDVATKNGAKPAGPVPLPTEREVITVIRSPHKYKDSREQFESRTHKRLIDIHNPNQKLMEALQRLEMPAGVDVQIKF